MSAVDMSPHELAVEFVLGRIRADGRIAYLMGYGTETFALLTYAHATLIGEDVEQFRKRFWMLCQPEKVRIVDEDGQ